MFVFCLIACSMMGALNMEKKKINIANFCIASMKASLLLNCHVNSFLHIYAFIVGANGVDPDQLAHPCCQIRVCTVGFSIY